MLLRTRVTAPLWAGFSRRSVETGQFGQNRRVSRWRPDPRRSVRCGWRRFEQQLELLRHGRPRGGQHRAARARRPARRPSGYGPSAPTARRGPSMLVATWKSSSRCRRERSRWRFMGTVPVGRAVERSSMRHPSCSASRATASCWSTVNPYSSFTASTRPANQHRLWSGSQSAASFAPLLLAVQGSTSASRASGCRGR